MSKIEGMKLHQENDRIEQLRLILERQHILPVSRSEAETIGAELISFFETLGEEPLFEVEPIAQEVLGVGRGQLQ